jgi:hypothetical protein
MRRAFSEAVSEEDLVEVVGMIKRKAKEGDMAAAKLLLAYVIGKPGPVVEPDTLDLEEFKHYEEESRHYRNLPAVAASADLGLACTIARTSRPGIAEVAARDLSHALVEGEFPEGSPFREVDDFDCQELPGSDTAPSAIGENGAEAALGGTVPAIGEGTGGQELLETLGLASAAGPKVDATVVALAVALLQEAIVQSNAGKDVSAGEQQPAPGLGGDTREGLSRPAAEARTGLPSPSGNRGNGAAAEGESRRWPPS